MFNSRSRPIFVFVLLAIFTMLKWTPVHAHLNALHGHNGEQHQHDVKAHAHQSVIFHNDHSDENHSEIFQIDVVDLDHNQNHHNDRKIDDKPSLTGGMLLPLLVKRWSIGVMDLYDLPHRFHPPNPSQPRAPPKHS